MSAGTRAFGLALLLLREEHAVLSRELRQLRRLAQRGAVDKEIYEQEAEALRGLTAAIRWLEEGPGLAWDLGQTQGMGPSREVPDRFFTALRELARPAWGLSEPPSGGS